MPVTFVSARVRTSCPIGPEAARSTTSRSCALNVRSTATSRRTSRSSWPASLRRPPREIAETLVAELGAGPEDELLSKAEVAGAGFVNVWLAPAYVEAQVDEIRRRARATAGRSVAQPQRINVEFVSAPIPPGRSPSATPVARSWATCSAACSRRSATEVTREYYFNDSGAQVEKLGLSIRAIRLGEADTGGWLPRRLRGRPRCRRCRTTCGRRPKRSRPKPAGSSGDGRRSRSAPGSRPAWRTWASISTCGRARARCTGGLGRAGDRASCAASGDLYEQDGALWFRSTAYGDDKDRVVIRSNGEPTYFASDIGYVAREVRPRLTTS